MRFEKMPSRNNTALDRGPVIPAGPALAGMTTGDTKFHNRQVSRWVTCAQDARGTDDRAKRECGSARCTYF